MKTKQIYLPAALLAAVLTLSLLAGCGADTPEEPSTPSPEQSHKVEPSLNVEEPEVPSAEPAETPEPEDTPEPTDTPGPSATPEPTPTPTPEPTPTPIPQPTPTPAPESTPEPTQSGPEDGSYTANVTLSGGSGRATVQSPAALRCTNGQFFATIVWSSPNFDYMKVNGTRYDPVSAPGSNSAFEIPVAAFDQALPVIADTVAMSEPHEVEYTLTFDSSTLAKQ